jgi:DNA-binding IclR family transcriptional regulator
MTEQMPQGEKTVSDEQILDAIKRHEDPFVAASEVAEMFDHTRQWAHARLSRLHEAGKVNRKGAGERSVIWWVDD